MRKTIVAMMLIFVMVFAFTPITSVAMEENEPDNAVIEEQGETPGSDIASGTCGTCTWVIDANGAMTISEGVLEKWDFTPPWAQYSEQVTSFRTEGPVVLYTGENMFNDFNQVKTLDLRDLDTSGVNTMRYMFMGCSSLESIDISSFDTSSCWSMYYMFQGCSSLKSIDLSNLDTSHTSNMFGMFSSCSALKSLDVTGFVTSNVNIMDYMFEGCSSLTELDVSNFDTSNVTSMRGMFYGLNVKSIDVSNFDTSKVGDMGEMFGSCKNLTELDLSNFNTSNVRDMYAMFTYSHSLTSLDLSTFDISKVTDMYCMLNGCDSLTTLKTGKWTYNDNIETLRDIPYFPIKMYDNADGAEYEAGARIPSRDYRTYVIDPRPVSMEDDFKKGYVRFEYEKSYASELGETKVYYSDDYFLQGNEEYSSKAAKASLGLAMASNFTYTASEYLRSCGFRYYIEQSPRYYTSLTNDDDQVAYSFAVKEINGKTAIAVVLRGGHYGNEWGSNGRVGHLGETLGYHYGFNAAADDVINDLEQYCDKYDFDLKESIIWLTGYSRSAAVANCVGAKLEKDGKINKNNLYCYGFATPRTVTREKIYKDAQGIFSTVNPLDLVPCVPLNSSTVVAIHTYSTSKTAEKPWNYTRHGEVVELPSKIGTWKYGSKLDEMRAEFSKITKGERYYQRFEGVYLQGILDAAAASTKSEKNFVVYLQDQLVVPALEKYMGNGLTDDAAILEVISIIPGARKILKEKGYFKEEGKRALESKAGAADTKLGMQHWPETYLAWLNTPYEPKKASAVKTIMVQCPVDVEVYDSDNNIAASIYNDQIDEYMEYDLEAFVDEDGAKYVTMPADANYSVRLMATDDGTMTYSVYESDDTREVQRKVTFEDIPISNGQVFTGEVNNELNTDAENYNLETEGEVIVPDKDYSEDDIGSIEINVEVSGEGTIIGDGFYTAGDSVVLQAYATDDSTFEGWYQGNTLVSGENTLTFKAETSKTYMAKFSAGSGDPEEPECDEHEWEASPRVDKPATCTEEGSESIHCSKCNAVQEGSEQVIPATGHKFGSWEITIPATETTQGEEARTCSVCGFVEKQPIPKLTPSTPSTPSVTPAAPADIVDLPVVKISKPAAAKKAVTIKWKKVSKKNQKKIQGIEIQVATDSGFTDIVKTATASKKKTSKKIKGLTSKQTYYVRIRAYKDAADGKHVSAWKTKKFKAK